MRCNLPAAAVATVFASLLATLAHADDLAELTASELVERAEEAYDDLSYEEALEAAEAALSDPEITSAHQLAALEIAGLSHFILGREDAAAAAFVELLAIDPYYQLSEDTGSPKIREAFEEARQRARDDTFAELVHAAPTSAQSAGIAEFEVAVGRGAGEIVEMAIAWRERGDARFRRAPVRRTEHDEWAVSFTLPASNERWVLEYYVEARDARGQPIGRVGAPNSPLAIPVSPTGAGARPGSTPWFRRWYVIGAGAAALGAAGLAVGLSAGGSSSQGTLEPGSVTITP